MLFKGCTVAMLTYYVEKTTMTCSLMIGHLFDAIIIASTYKSCSIDPSKYKCWKVSQSGASHLEYCYRSSKKTRFKSFQFEISDIFGSIITKQKDAKLCRFKFSKLIWAGNVSSCQKQQKDE